MRAYVENPEEVRTNSRYKEDEEFFLFQMVPEKAGFIEYEDGKSHKVKDLWEVETRGNPLEETNMIQALLIQVSRLYDVQMALLTLTAPDVADKVEQAHSSGEFIGPDPAIRI